MLTHTHISSFLRNTYAILPHAKTPERPDDIFHLTADGHVTYHSWATLTHFQLYVADSLRIMKEKLILRDQRIGSKIVDWYGYWENLSNFYVCCFFKKECETSVLAGYTSNIKSSKIQTWPSNNGRFPASGRRILVMCHVINVLHTGIRRLIHQLHHTSFSQSYTSINFIRKLGTHIYSVLLCVVSLIMLRFSVIHSIHTQK